jgi:tetratricopeptide (TPR) repeat protein
MARLPRYQESGLISADIPRMDFANVREESRQSQAIGDALSRISEFAFGAAQKQREQQNKLMGIQLRTDLEMQAQVELANLTAQIETRKLKDPKVIQETLVALGQQGAKVLGQYSVEQANGYMNTIANQGRAIIAKSSDLYVKEYKAGIDVLANDAIRAQSLNLETVYETAPTIEGALAAVIESRGRIAEVAAQASNSDKVMQDFEKASINARNNVLVRAFSSPEFADRPSAALAKLDANDAGRYSQVWATMTMEEKDAVRERILKRQADIYSQTERERKAADEANKVTGLDIREQLYRGRIGPNEAIKRLRAINDISPSEMQSILKGDVGGANDELYGRFESMVDRGQMGEAAIDTYAKSGYMSWKQANALKKIARGTDKDYTEAKRYIDKSLGVPDPMVPGFRNERARAAEVQKQFIEERERALTAGEAFNPIETAQRLVTGRKQQDDVKLQEAAKARLEKKLEEAGLKYREDYTTEDLRRAGVNNRDIKVITNLSKQVRGE